MNTFSQTELGMFLRLFIRNGYVLDFSTNEFDIFTLESVGVSLCEKYKQSKGKSLTTYLQNATDAEIVKIISDLFSYYETHFQREFNTEVDEWGYSTYNDEYGPTYEKCKAIINRIHNITAPLAENAEKLKERFSSDFLSKQIDLMIEMQKFNPTDAIGKSKELIESCCKTILEEKGIEWKKEWEIGILANEALNSLNLLPKNIQETDPVANTIKGVLGNLRAITAKLAELRNPYGTGHGKSASFIELEERHAKLAVGSSITFVTFLWDTYEEEKRG